MSFFLRIRKWLYFCIRITERYHHIGSSLMPSETARWFFDTIGVFFK